MSRLRSFLYRLTLAILRQVPPDRHRRFKLVILKLDRLGDAVLSLGAVRLLLAEFGPAGSLLIVSTVAEPLYRKEFPNVELLVMPPFSGRFWPDFVQTMAQHAASLRAIDTDQLVILRHQPSDYLHAIAALMQVRQVHATDYPNPLESICLSYPPGPRTLYPKQNPDTCLELEAHRRVVQSAVNHAVAWTEVLPVLPQTGTTTTLLVCPLTGSPVRQYPPASLAQAVALFLQSTAHLSITFCLPPGADRTPWENAANAAGIPSVTWLHPQDLATLFQTISAAGLILAPDSAPAHLATAMNKPGVFLLGGGQHGMFAPWQRSPLQIWLQHPMACYHCQWRCIHAEPLCITQISPTDIASALQKVYAACFKTNRQSA